MSNISVAFVRNCTLITRAAGAISQLWRDDESAFASNLHGADALLPSLGSPQPAKCANDEGLRDGASDKEP